MTPSASARSRAARDSWDDAYGHAMRSIAIREGWFRHRQRVVKAQPPSAWNVFLCRCGEECVGTWHGPQLCSVCRERALA